MKTGRPKNKGLGVTQITPDIRVSSAAIFYQVHFGDYWQYETWIFSDDPIQRSVQAIHGTSGIGKSERLEQKTKKIHNYISNNMIAKHSKEDIKRT